MLHHANVDARRVRKNEYKVLYNSIACSSISRRALDFCASGHVQFSKSVFMHHDVSSFCGYGCVGFLGAITIP
eukprot:6203480-Pleurochrysis_carterae.AAC.1